MGSFFRASLRVHLEDFVGFVPVEAPVVQDEGAQLGAVARQRSEKGHGALVAQRFRRMRRRIRR